MVLIADDHHLSMKIAILMRSTRATASFHAAREDYEINLDLVCASKPGVLPLVAGERVVGHGSIGPRLGCGVVDE